MGMISPGCLGSRGGVESCGWLQRTHTHVRESCRTVITLILPSLAQARASRGDTERYGRVQRGPGLGHVCAAPIRAASGDAGIERSYVHPISHRSTGFQKQLPGILVESTSTLHSPSKYLKTPPRSSASFASPIPASTACALATSPTGTGTERGCCRESRSGEAAAATAQLPGQRKASPSTGVQMPLGKRLNDCPTAASPSRGPSLHYCTFVQGRSPITKYFCVIKGILNLQPLEIKCI